jgi:hypothetical protein
MLVQQLPDAFVYGLIDQDNNKFIDQKLRTDPVNFTTWMNLSRSFLPMVYDIKGHKLDDSYMQSNKAFVEAQLKNAGTLLASCLENLFSQATKIPVGPAPTAV